MKRFTDRESIVAHGRELIQRSAEYQEKAKEVRTRVADSYRDRLSAASGWRLLLLKWRIEKEIQKALDELAPAQGLYSVSR